MVKLICELKEVSASVILNSASILIFCDLLHKSERIGGYREIIKRKGIRKEDPSKRGWFVSNRFGKRQVIYDKIYNGIQKKMREAQYADDKEVNVVSSNITLDDWYVQWMKTYKNNCRNNTKETYARHYKRVKEELGWRKLNQLNLLVLQKAINNLKTDNERKNSKKILVDMLEKAVDTNLISKNVARQVNTVITKEEQKERRVLTKDETKIFLEEAKNSFYYDLFIVALETGMRVGELSGLQWEDVDLKKEWCMSGIQ